MTTAKRDASSACTVTSNLNLLSSSYAHMSRYALAVPSNDSMGRLFLDRRRIYKLMVHKLLAVGWINLGKVLSEERIPTCSR